MEQSDPQVLVVKEHPTVLWLVSGFELEKSQSSDSGRTYRIIARLAEEKSIPLTSAYTSGDERKRQRVAMLNQWLGRESQAMELGR